MHSSRVASSSSSSSGMMDYNAPPNSCASGKPQQEFVLSSGLSIIVAIISAMKFKGARDLQVFLVFNLVLNWS